MTIKQDQILKTALELFAKEGFDATSTGKIARMANVSEGLIFRHFVNKEGLLEAILNQGQQAIQAIFENIAKIEDPKKIIEAIIELPFMIHPDEHNYWRLLYTLKWQQKKYDRVGVDFLMTVATDAFEKLGYENPTAEAEVLEMILDGAATVILLKANRHESEVIIKAIKEKYSKQ
jgi:AcrR family transcriptional regulator